jgi:hypothetical protein
VRIYSQNSISAIVLFLDALRAEGLLVLMYLRPLQAATPPRRGVVRLQTDQHDCPLETRHSASLENKLVASSEPLIYSSSLFSQGKLSSASTEPRCILLDAFDKIIISAAVICAQLWKTARLLQLLFRPPRR